MGKHQKFGGKDNRQPDNVFPAEFDADIIVSFFEGSQGVSQDVLTFIKAALDNDTNGIGQVVSEIASVGRSNDDNIEFGDYFLTDEDEFFHHVRGHDEGEHEEEIQDAAFGRPLHAGGNKNGGSGDETTSGGGRGKEKKKDAGSTDPEPEPESVPTPEPESVPAPEPAPSDDYGWVTSSTYLSGGDTPDGFNVEMVFNGSWTQSQKNVGAAQAELLSDYITGDLSDYGSIDDVRIQIYKAELAGSTLGQAGWITLRGDNMVAEGGVRLDASSLANVESSGLLDELFMHEMLHAIGFGTTWTYDGLISNGHFVGENARDVYGSPVPLNGNGHLAESVGDEMGTTYIVNNAENITDLTLAILEDMGYETIYDSTAYV